MWGEAKIGDYNLFGRKWGGWGRYIELPTKEDDGNGNLYTIIAKFQDYDSLDQALVDWCELMLWNGPGPTIERTYKYWSDQYKIDKDLEKFIGGMAGIYATDTEYKYKIIDTIRAAGLTQFDGVA
jgi:flagellum-specific peptidoglycan hydrolase FlgJ